MRTRLIVLSLALLGLSAAAAQAWTGPVRAGACTSGAVVSTRSYELALGIGRAEPMYSPAQVKANHPTSGEVMLGGRMAMMGTAPAGMRNYHLEVHICRPNGAVATKLSPRITIDDPMGMAGMAMTKLPVAIMQGVGEGISDYHYGNETALTPGHTVTVTVTVEGQKAVFHARVPKS